MFCLHREGYIWNLTVLEMYRQAQRVLSRYQAIIYEKQERDLNSRDSTPMVIDSFKWLVIFRLFPLEAKRIIPITS